MFNQSFQNMSKTRLGMVLALCGFTSYAISDICAKWLLQDYSLYQVIFINNIFACAALLIALPWLGGKAALFSMRHKRLHALRGVLNVSISLLIGHSFTLLPIADVYTFIFAMPFYAAVIGIVLYGEKVTRNRWIAIIIGFGGVLIALQPGAAGFNPALLWPLACGITISLMFSVTKSMQGESLFAIGFWPLTVNVAFCGFMAFQGGMQSIALFDMMIFALNGATIALGILTVSNAFRIAPSAAISPFLYTEMIWAIVFGYLIFGDVPGGMMLAGAGVIILSGFYLIESERRTKT